MELKQFFLEKLDREVEVTRKALSRVPEVPVDWKPHPRSMELGYLAALVATMLGWISLMVERDELNLDDPGNGGLRPRATTVRAELLQMLDESATSARRALEGTTEEHLMKHWQFKINGQAVNDLPRYVMLADSAFSHLAHHRGQLTVYLRLNEEKVPAIYGPSADEFH